MIRFLIVCFIVVGYLIITIPLLLAEWILKKFNPKASAVSSLRTVQAAFRLILKVTGVTVTVIGYENIPKDTPVLYIGNHRSFFDILLTYTRCIGLTGYIAKAEMEQIPLLSQWMKLLNCLFLDRKDLKKGMKTIMEGIDKIKSGISICIFPEGTRNRNEDELDLLTFHEGSFKLATKTGCPIVPIALNNTVSIFEKQFPRIRKTHVVIEYCKPIDPRTLSRDEQRALGRYCRTIILETLKKNQSRVNQ